MAVKIRETNEAACATHGEGPYPLGGECEAVLVAVAGVGGPEAVKAAGVLREDALPGVR